MSANRPLSEAVGAVIAPTPAPKPPSMFERIGQALGMLSASGDRTAQRLDAIEARIAALEDGRFDYVGVHQEGREYRAGEIVTRSGSLWLAERDTDSTPGHGATAWKLVAKRGHFGP